jgi:hypothetical protein
MFPSLKFNPHPPSSSHDFQGTLKGMFIDFASDKRMHFAMPKSFCSSSCQPNGSGRLLADSVALGTHLGSL